MVCAAAAVVVSCGAFGADSDDDDAPAPARADSGSSPDRDAPSDATSDDVASPTDAGPDAEVAGPTTCDEIPIQNLKPEEGDTCAGNTTRPSVPGSGEPTVGLPFVNIGTGVCGAVQAGRKDSFQVPHLAGECVTIEFVPSNPKATITISKSLTGTFPSGSTYTGGARRVVVNVTLATLSLEITSPEPTTYTLAVF